MKLQEPIWERQKGERSKAFYLFSIYRDLGPLRSLEKVHVKLTNGSPDAVGIRQLKKYSTTCQWVCRTEAYDDHIDEIQRREQEQAIKEMTKRHATNSRTLQDEILDIKTTPGYNELTPTQKAWALNSTVHSYVKIALLERLSQGETTDKTEVNAEIKGNEKARLDEIKDLFKYAKGETKVDDLSDD